MEKQHFKQTFPGQGACLATMFESLKTKKIKPFSGRMIWEKYFYDFIMSVLQTATLATLEMTTLLMIVK